MTETILDYLRVRRSTPTLHYLQELMSAYCSRVPWESVSKIIKQKIGENGTDCLRLENEFWSAAFRYGTGGTCYESNWAFFYLLQNLGYNGYLTINRVMDKSSVHSASVILIDDKKYLVDIGYPTYAPIAVSEEMVTVCDHLGIQYRCTPASTNEYVIENFPHPKPYLYHLTDIPVHPKDYLEIASKDYGDDGLFSDRIIIRKLIKGVPTRFNSEDVPYNIHTLHKGEKPKTFIKREDLVSRLSNHFGMNPEIIRKAFQILGKE